MTQVRIVNTPEIGLYLRRLQERSGEQIAEAMIDRHTDDLRGARGVLKGILYGLIAWLMLGAILFALWKAGVLL